MIKVVVVLELGKDATHEEARKLVARVKNILEAEMADMHLEIHTEEMSGGEFLKRHG